MTQSKMETKRYRIVFAIDSLPRTPNQLLGAHWTVRSNHAKRWAAAVAKAVYLNGGAPAQPLIKARIEAVRESSGRMDTDGLSGSFKAPIDALVKCGVIIDDTPDHIAVTYRQERSKPKHGRIIITVEEV